MAKNHSKPTTGPKKSRRSKSRATRPIDRQALRVLLAILLLLFAFAISLSPDLMLETHLVLAFFIIGALVGTLIQVYWIRVLMRDAGFYSEFYSVGPHRTHQKFKKDTVVRHTRNVLPFYIFLALVFIILWFMIGIFGLDLAYSLPFLLGLPEGLPIGYYLAEKNCI